jgi:hypothetical protein
MITPQEAIASAIGFLVRSTTATVVERTKHVGATLNRLRTADPERSRESSRLHVGHHERVSLRTVTDRTGVGT